MATPKKPGRKLKPGNRDKTLTKAQIERAIAYAEAGMPNTQIADRLKVSVTTFWKLRKRYPSLAKGLNESRIALNERVETSLYHRATGYKITREKPVVVAGELVTARYKEHIPADVGAAKFWLTNRAPEQWSERKQLDIGVSVKRNFDDEPALEATVVSEQ